MPALEQEFDADDQGREKATTSSDNQEIKMKLESPAFLNNQNIPAKYTCDGENISPPLKILDVPEGAKSLALIVDDPDASSGSWLHWMLWNISPTTTQIAEVSIPEGAVEGLTDFGKTGYGGPCPPSNTHRYFFKLFALDTMLELSDSAKLQELEQAMQEHIIEQAELIGFYARQN